MQKKNHFLQTTFLMSRGGSKYSLLGIFQKQSLKKSFWIIIFQALKNRFAKKSLFTNHLFDVERGVQISFARNFPRTHINSHSRYVAGFILLLIDSLHYLINKKINNMFMQGVQKSTIKNTITKKVYTWNINMDQQYDIIVSPEKLHLYSSYFS